MINPTPAATGKRQADTNLVKTNPCIYWMPLAVASERISTCRTVVVVAFAHDPIDSAIIATRTQYCPATTRSDDSWDACSVVVLAALFHARDRSSAANRDTITFSAANGITDEG